MTDQGDDLRETLDVLHEQLAAAGDLDPASRKQLSETMGEILSKLADEDHSDEDAHASWVDRLRESIEHFEDDHPDLVQAVDRVARALSRVGF